MSTISPVPGIVAAVSLFFLASTGCINNVITAFLEHLTVTEQISLLSLSFALVYFAIDIALFVGPSSAITEHSHGEHSPTFQYPLNEMSACKNDREKFTLIYPTLRDDIILQLEMLSKGELPRSHEAMKWLVDCMDYNVPGGKLIRGLTVVDVQRTLVSANQNRNLTELEVARASVLGWALEFLQAFFLVADDVMDDSQTRRGQPCWYKLPKVGNIAINDSFLLESFVFTLLKRHFGSEPYYGDLLDLFLEVTLKTELGQLLDLTSQPLDSTTGKAIMDLERFTIDRHALIVKYKTAFYTFYLPVAIGMITSGIPCSNKKAYQLAQKICCIMGEYFQIQDDYLDCYGDPKTIGKVGTDIQDNKCSWLVVQALDRASPAQREILELNYGQWDEAKVANVKKLYDDLNLKEAFEKYEEESYQRIQLALDEVETMPRDVFELLLKRIYKRKY